MKYYSSVVVVAAALGWIGSSAAWAPRGGAASADRLPRPHYLDAQPQTEDALPRAIQAAAGGLASVMAPLFAANAAVADPNNPNNYLPFQSGQPQAPLPAQLTDLQGIFSNALENIADTALLHPSEVNERIATSIVTAVNERGVATNAEMYALVQQGWNNLVAALEKLDGLSPEEKTAAAIATIVLSYPVSYEYYKYEQAEEERKAQEKRAAMALKRKQAAAKKNKSKKGTQKKKATAKKAGKAKATTTTTKGNTGTASVPQQRKSGPKGSPAPQTAKRDDAVPPEVSALEEARVVVTMDNATPSVVAQAPPPVGGQSAPRSSSPGNAGMDAYAQAYAAMMQQSATAPAPATPSTTTAATATSSQPVATKHKVVTTAPISATASYLDNLSP